LIPISGDHMPPCGTCPGCIGAIGARVGTGAAMGGPAGPKLLFLNVWALPCCCKVRLEMAGRFRSLELLAPASSGYGHRAHDSICAASDRRL
jgi:hypothetical protein